MIILIYLVSFFIHQIFQMIRPDTSDIPDEFSMTRDFKWKNILKRIDSVRDE